MNLAGISPLFECTILQDTTANGFCKLLQIGHSSQQVLQSQFLVVILRRPGQSRITTPRKESDTCKILSGVGDGVTLGTPIAVVVPNEDQRGGDYSEISLAYRPSHADATYDFKYGVRAVQGGGRSSARETIGRVAAGAVAKKLLQLQSGTEVGECQQFCGHLLQLCTKVLTC
jgi:chorismate synthase